MMEDLIRVAGGALAAVVIAFALSWMVTAANRRPKEV